MEGFSLSYEKIKRTYNRYTRRARSKNDCYFLPRFYKECDNKGEAWCLYLEFAARLKEGK